MKFIATKSQQLIPLSSIAEIDEGFISGSPAKVILNNGREATYSHFVGYETLPNTNHNLKFVSPFHCGIEFNVDIFPIVAWHVPIEGSIYHRSETWAAKPVAPVSLEDGAQDFYGILDESCGRVTDQFGYQYRTLDEYLKAANKQLKEREQIGQNVRAVG